MAKISEVPTHSTRYNDEAVDHDEETLTHWLVIALQIARNARINSESEDNMED